MKVRAEPRDCAFYGWQATEIEVTGTVSRRTIDKVGLQSAFSALKQKWNASSEKIEKALPTPGMDQNVSTIQDIIDATKLICIRKGRCETRLEVERETGLSIF